jgi:hypothetical protein
MLLFLLSIDAARSTAWERAAIQPKDRLAHFGRHAVISTPCAIQGQADGFPRKPGPNGRGWDGRRYWLGTTLSTTAAWAGIRQPSPASGA